MSGKPDDLPPVESYPHGSRARYVAGCRCSDCRRANTEYAKQRAKAQRNGDWNGLVDATKARKHLHMLSSRGVGRRAVQAACDVALTVLEDIKAGKKTRIRARTEKAILSVDEAAISDGALVPADETWRMLRKLLKLGYTKTELARELGSKAKTPSLQLKGEMVLAKNAQRVKRLYNTIMNQIEEEKELAVICPTCGYSHDKDDRQSTLKMMLPTTISDIKDAWSCFYGGIAGERQLYRDLNEIGAEASNGMWRLHGREEESVAHHPTR